MCSTVFERKQVWGAHLSLLGQELNPILVTTSGQSQHNTSSKSQMMTSSEHRTCCSQVGPRAARACRCAQMCRTLENNQGRPAELPAPPHRQLRWPRRPCRSLFRMPHIPLAVLQTFHPHRSTL